MSGARPAAIVRQLESTDATDDELLARFAATRDAAAFAELVRRHGGLVLGVCRRVTRHPQDAEDAFQATFLVLARRVGALRPGVRLWSWLYGVAFRVAWRARRAAARRRRREVAVAHVPEMPTLPAEPLEPELALVLDEELAALPSHYRDALVLCALQGVSREDAAVTLGIPEGTLSSRLANGRKKLAARLTRRGVAPAALVLVDARAAVPHELLVRACGTALDCAAGGPVPRPLAHLLRGGATVRRTFVACVAGLAAVGGAVFAALPTSHPPVAEPLPSPKAAEKAPGPPKPKGEEAPQPAGKVPFATEPKRLRAFDTRLSSATLLWNPTGTRLAVAGQEVVPQASGTPGAVQKTAGRFKLYSPESSDGTAWGHLPQKETLEWVAPDGRAAAALLREHGLISGEHQLIVKEPAQKDGDSLTLIRKIDLDLPEAFAYAFAADGKTFRAVAHQYDASGKLVRLEVLEVDAASGKAGPPLVSAAFGPYALSANGKRLAVLSDGESKLAVYDVDRGAKRGEYALPAEDPAMPRPEPVAISSDFGGYQPPRDGTTFVVLSPDGRRAVVSRGIGRTTVLNADTGAALPPLDGAADARSFPDAQAFTADGRLLAAVCQAYTRTVRQAGGKDKREVAQWSAAGHVLTVWDTETGKALKAWPRGGGVRVAFGPTRPLLAILEPNGESDTRLGFWDFAAGSEKK